MQGRHWATVLGRLTCAPGTFGEAGVLREMGAVGIRPPIPSPLPQNLNAVLQPGALGGLAGVQLT